MFGCFFNGSHDFLGYPWNMINMAISLRKELNKPPRGFRDDHPKKAVQKPESCNHFGSTPSWKHGMWKWDDQSFKKKWPKLQSPPHNSPERRSMAESPLLLTLPWLQTSAKPCRPLDFLGGEECNVVNIMLIMLEKQSQTSHVLMVYSTHQNGKSLGMRFWDQEHKLFENPFVLSIEKISSRPTIYTTKKKQKHGNHLQHTESVDFPHWFLDFSSHGFPHFLDQIGREA